MFFFVPCMVYAALSAFNNNEALYTMDIYGSLWKDRWPSPNMVYTVINMAHGTKMGIPGQAAPDSKKISSNLHRGKSLWTIAIDPLKTGQHFPFLKHTMNDAELQPRNYLIFCFFLFWAAPSTRTFQQLALLPDVPKARYQIKGDQPKIFLSKRCWVLPCFTPQL